jgi:hypothetical protein
MPRSDGRNKTLNMELIRIWPSAMTALIDFRGLQQAGVKKFSMLLFYSIAVLSMFLAPFMFLINITENEAIFTWC